MTSLLYKYMYQNVVHPLHEWIYERGSVGCFHFLSLKKHVSDTIESWLSKLNSPNFEFFLPKQEGLPLLDAYMLYALPQQSLFLRIVP
jgi:hypothetical protein